MTTIKNEIKCAADVDEYNCGPVFECIITQEKIGDVFHYYRDNKSDDDFYIVTITEQFTGIMYEGTDHERVCLDERPGWLESNKALKGKQLEFVCFKTLEHAIEYLSKRSVEIIKDYRL